ncbi:Vesicle trafficking between the ER and Golgi [Entophlyctis luteolus]|nr:Vesicle trafficking between the ER and Golgi [Entophlyctis luteolus]
MSLPPRYLSCFYPPLLNVEVDAVAVMLHLNNKDSFAAMKANKEKKTVAASDALVLPQVVDTVWKILVYDKPGQDIISQLMKVNELRECGVTVHMPLLADRQPIPDVPAVYFVHPSPENIKRIGEDLAKNLYESYYLNFTNTIPRSLLEDLAAASAASNTTVQIAQVYDQYLNFVSLEDKLFTLNFNETYKLLNDANATDRSIDSITENIVSSLFSVVATMGTIPVIRCPRGNAAATVAAKLDQRRRDHVMNSRNNNLFSDQSTLASSSTPPSLSPTPSGSGNVSVRPVLVILDRNMDLGAMLSHTWTYSTLVHDLLEMKLNKVAFEVDEKGKKIKKSFNIDANDFFWNKNCGNPFPQVADDVNTEINRYKKDVEEVTKSSGASSLEEMDPNANAETLKYALTALPELTDRKRTLDMHMNIATHLFQIISARKLDAFFAMTESLGKQTRASVLEMVKDADKQPIDKLRFMLVFYLAQEDVAKEDLAAYEEALTAAGVGPEGIAALAYLKGVKSFVKMAAASNSAAAGGVGGSQGLTAGGDLFGKFNKLVEGSGVGGGLENLISGVRNLLPSRKDMPATTIVQSILEGNTAGTDAEDFLTFDPKSPRGASGSSMLGAKSPGKVSGNSNFAQTSKVAYQQAIVFVVGGGNYLEYQNLQDYAQRTQQKKKITYGATEIVTASAFLAQLQSLGSK